MRRLLLTLFTIATLIGLPRLADRFREVRVSDNGNGEGALPAKVGQQPRVESEPSAKSSAPNLQAGQSAPQAIPVSLKSPEAQAQPKSALQGAGQSPLQLSDEEVIAAIQKELVRLGYYDGAVNGKWNRGSRAAARAFARHESGRARNQRPTLKLLAVLQAAQPEGKHEVEREPDLHLQSAEPAAQSRAPNDTSIPIPEPARVTAQSDGYLPPWEKEGTTAPQRVSASSEDVLRPAPALPSSRSVTKEDAQTREERHSRNARNSGRRRHRFVRAARERRNYASYRGSGIWIRRRSFGNSNFSWPGL